MANPSTTSQIRRLWNSANTSKHLPIRRRIALGRHQQPACAALVHK